MEANSLRSAEAAHARGKAPPHLGRGLPRLRTLGLLHDVTDDHFRNLPGQLFLGLKRSLNCCNGYSPEEATDSIRARDTLAPAQYLHLCGERRAPGSGRPCSSPSPRASRQPPSTPTICRSGGWSAAFAPSTRIFQGACELFKIASLSFRKEN